MQFKLILSIAYRDKHSDIHFNNDRFGKRVFLSLQGLIHRLKANEREITNKSKYACPEKVFLERDEISKKAIEAQDSHSGPDS